MIRAIVKDAADVADDDGGKDADEGGKNDGGQS